MAAETVHGKPQWCCEVVEDIHTVLQQLAAQPGTSYPWLPLATHTGAHVTQPRLEESCQHNSDNNLTYLRRSLPSAWSSFL